MCIRDRSRAFLCSVLRKDTPRKRCFSAGLSEGGERLGETQLFLFSDPPRRWFYFDYDPGPLSCVHLHKFKILSFLALQAYYISLKMPGQPCKRSISGILPYKNTQRPPRCLRLHRKGRCVRILLWCEEESCTRNRLRPRILMAVV